MTKPPGQPPPRAAAKPGMRDRQLPVKTSNGKAMAKASGNAARQVVSATRSLTEGLPAATLIYAIGAAVLFTLAIYFLFSGHWVNGLLTLLPAACLTGYAVYFLKQVQ